MTSTSYSLLETPFGELLLAANETALTRLSFQACAPDPAERAAWTPNPKHPVLVETARQLREYFEGKRTCFSVPLHLDGTEFQRRVWQEIARIPFGKTLSYSELAINAGRPQAIRAAGGNTGRNPIGIIVPCHRILEKGGGLGGFAGGLTWKRHLLELEGIIPKAQRELSLIQG